MPKILLWSQMFLIDRFSEIADHSNYILLIYSFIDFIHNMCKSFQKHCKNLVSFQEKYVNIQCTIPTMLN